MGVKGTLGLSRDKGEIVGEIALSLIGPCGDVVKEGILSLLDTPWHHVIGCDFA